MRDFLTDEAAGGLILIAAVALAFAGDPALVEQARIGILAGSLASALAGYVLLRLAPGASD